MDRAIPLRLEAMSEIDRRTEEEIRREFEQLLPELLHDLYMAVAHGLRTIERIPPPTSIRMADAAHWLVAAEEGAGLPAGTILAALEKAQGTTQADLAMHDSLFAELERVLMEEDFEGRPAELLQRLRERRRAYRLIAIFHRLQHNCRRGFGACDQHSRRLASSWSFRSELAKDAISAHT